MEIFNLTLRQMMMMFTFIIAGYILRKSTLLPDNSDKVLSKLETFFLVPSMTLYSWMKNCTIQSLSSHVSFILYGTVIVAIAVAIAYPVSRLFVPDADSSPEKSYTHQVYKYAVAFGNYGFVGNFLALGVWGDEGLFKYLLFTLIVGLVCSTWGLLVLIPKKNNENTIKEVFKKALTAPPIIALLIGMVAGLFNLSRFVPSFLSSTLENASNCMGPISMILAGFVIGGYDFKELLSNNKVYLITFLRLILIPSIMLIILKLLGTDKEIMTYALIAFAAPIGLNTIVYPATYGGETKTGASMAMISHTLSVLTIPIMYYIFIV